MKEYLISTKADTLADLREIVKHSYIEELSIVYAEDFFGNPAGVIAAIKEQFTGEMIVVRSSSKSEDNLETSNAGHFESVLGVDASKDAAITEAIETVYRSYVEGDFTEEAKQQLIVHNLRLVVYIARRFENTGINIEDLISIGTIGLIKAVGTYQPAKNIKLATYASRCIENEILMYLRKCSAQKTEVSIDEPLNTDWDGNELLLSDILGTDGQEIVRPLEDDADREMLHTAISMLADREKQIILMRFGFIGGTEYTQKEVADMMGISQSYISRLEKRIIARLHREMVRQMQV